MVESRAQISKTILRENKKGNLAWPYINTNSQSGQAARPRIEATGARDVEWGEVSSPSGGRARPWQWRATGSPSFLQRLTKGNGLDFKQKGAV